MNALLRKPRILSVLFVALLSGASVACTEPSSEEASGSGQAIAEDEIVVEPIAMGADGSLEVPSILHERTQAKTWRAFRAAKRETPSETFVLMAAYGGDGKQLYEAAIYTGEQTRVDFRDPEGKTIEVSRRDDGKPILKIGDLEVDIESVAADWAIYGNSLNDAQREPESADPGAARPMSAGGDASCALSVGRALAGAAGALVGGVLVTISCPGAVVSIGVASVFCATSVLAVAGGSVAALAHGKQALQSCR